MARFPPLTIVQPEKGTILTKLMDKISNDKSRFLVGQVAVVTGAGRGIGAAIAKTLAELGATVVLCGRTRAALDSSAKAIAEAGGKAEVIPCDVTSLESVEAAAKRIESSFGRVDILVNNAGIGGFGGPLAPACSRCVGPDSQHEFARRLLCDSCLGSHDDSCPVRPYHQHFIARRQECVAEWRGLCGFQVGTERVDLFRGRRIARFTTSASA